MNGRQAIRILMLTLLPIILAACSGFVIAASMVIVGAGLKTAFWSGIVGGTLLSATVLTTELMD